MDNDIAKTLDYLRKLCSAREYCVRDIRDKAEKRLGNAAEAEKVVETLQQEGYLSQQRYASAFARDKAAISGWGAYKIRYQLSSKGIPAAIIDQALEAIDGEKAEEKLRRSIASKCALLKGDPQIKIKLLKFALSRGYSYEEVNKVVSEILHGKNEDLPQIDGRGDLCP